MFRPRANRRPRTKCLGSGRILGLSTCNASPCGNSKNLKCVVLLCAEADMQSARITPQVPLMIYWEDQGDVTEPGLQSSQIRSARLEQQGRKPPVYNVSGSGRQKCPTRTRTPTPSDWEACSGWGTRGSGCGRGRGISCGVRNTGASGPVSVPWSLDS
jgi:hypothetical protein